jgi:D-alanyl-D-alanine carboxypeptidase
LNNAGFSEKPQNSPSASSEEDIPAALRDTPDAVSKVHVRRRPLIFMIAVVMGVFLLALISGFLFFINTPKKNTDSLSSSNSSIPERDAQKDSSVNAENKNVDALLGHLTYPEAPESELEPISSDGRMKLRKGAAQKYKEMTAAARRAGVILVPISGFRSVQQQEQVFFSIKAQRNQSAPERAAVSAPPGYSEHHTGYAVDIGDGAVPATNLNVNFEKTKAFEWLQANAGRFSFELSFPKDNPQGVSYEPWHWRYVGDRDSLETFYKARNLKPSPVSE